MAYKATGTYNDKDLSAADQAKIAQYKADYDAAKAAGNQAKMDEAHAAAQAVRAQYGYEGGKDGSEYNSLETGKSMVSGTSGSGKTTNTGGVKTGSSANQSSTVSNAQAALQNVGTIQNTTASGYDTGRITNQQEALEMMKLGSQNWNNSSFEGTKNVYASGNEQIAAQWFPGATKDKTSGVWYYNGKPLYDQDFSGSTSGVNFGGGYIPDVDQELREMIQWSTMPNGTPLNEALAAAGKNVPQMSLADQYGGGFTAWSVTGKQYNIGSDKGIEFIMGNGKDYMEGSDGSRWYRKEDGGIDIITRDGTLYTIPGSGKIETQAFEFPAFDQTFEYTPFEQTAAGQALMKDYQELLQKVQNYDPFEYNAAEDPLYLQYADSYTRSGQRAMQDILGQLSARTGGYASSYAGAMAQQTYDQYMADLANKIPELRNLAYSMYVDDYNRNVDNYNRAYEQYTGAYNRYAQDRQFDYNMYVDDYNRWYDSQKMAYDQYRDNVSDRQWNLTNSQNQNQTAKEWAYKLAQDEKSEAWKEKEWNYGLEQDKKAEQQAQAEKQENYRAQLYEWVLKQGYKPTYNDAQQAGLTDAEYQNLLNQYQLYWAADASKYFGGWSY